MNPRSLLTLALFLLPFAFSLRAQADEPAEPFCANGVIRIVRPQPTDEFDHWVPENNPDQGFLSSTLVRCEAAVADGIDPATVRWFVRPETGDGGRATGSSQSVSASPAPVATGKGLTFTFSPGSLPSRRHADRMAYEITAEVRDPRTGAMARDEVTICQDEIDQIRQEYVDFPRRSVAQAPRQAFLNYNRFEELWQDALPWKALNKTCSRNGGPYRYILLDPAVVTGMRRWRELLGGRELVITSAYRNPYKQAITSRRGGREAAPAGLHQYGKAVDVRASVTKDFRDWITVAWAAIDAGADYVETIPEGSANHVHADWRREGQGPADSVKLRITGRITNSSGAPVPGATVIGVSDAAGGAFAGMPAWQRADTEGRFELRAVWHPGRKYVVRAQLGARREVLAFTLPETSTPMVEKKVNFVLPSGSPAGREAPQWLARRLYLRSYQLASRGRSRWAPRRAWKRLRRR